MGRFYGLKIRAGEMTLEEVQTWCKPQVENWLKENPAK